MTSSTGIALSELHWIGFDLDHCIARYRLPASHELIHSCLVSFLVNHCGYNKSLLRTHLEYDAHFAAKGTVFDKREGNLLKLDSDGGVTMGYHGHTELSREQLDKLYANETHFSETDMAEPSVRYHSFTTYFDCPAVGLVATLIDLLDAGKLYEPSNDAEVKVGSKRPGEGEAPGAHIVKKRQTGPLTKQKNLKKISFQGVNGNEKYQVLLDDLVKAFRFSFGKFEMGEYFCEIAGNTEKYLYRRDDIAQWLRKLKREYGVCVYLNTNSRVKYMLTLLDAIFGPCDGQPGSGWDDLFELIIADGGKGRGFYSKPGKTETRPFRTVDPKTLAAADPIEFKDLKIRGDVKQPGTPSLLKGDALKQSGGWRTDITTLTTPIVMEGNSAELHELLKQGYIRLYGSLVKKHGSKQSESKDGGQDSFHCAYVGDHVKSDVVYARRYTPWLTVCVCEEVEGHDSDHGFPDHVHSVAVWEQQDHKEHHRSGKELWGSLRRKYTSLSVSKYWGSFHHGHGASEKQEKPERGMASLWYDYIMKNSHLVVDCLSTLSVRDPTEVRFSH